MPNKVLIFKSSLDAQISAAIKESAAKTVRQHVEAEIGGYHIQCPGCKSTVNLRHPVQQCVNGRYQQAVWKLKQIEKAARHLDQTKDRYDSAEVVKASQRFQANASTLTQLHPDIFKSD